MLEDRLHNLDKSKGNKIPMSLLVSCPFLNRLVELYSFNHFSRITTHDRIILDIFGNNRTGGYYRIFSDRNTGENGSSCTDPAVTFQPDGFAGQNLMVV